MNQVVSIYEYIKTCNPPDWSCEKFFDNERPVFFSKIPNSPRKKKKKDIVNYISVIKEQRLKPYYVARSKGVHVHCFNEVGSVSLTYENNLFLDVSTEYEFPNFKSKKVNSIKGLSVLLSIDSGSNYFHWMCHVLPRIKLLNEYGIDWKSVSNIIMPENRGSFVYETLNDLGVPIDKIIETSKNISYKFEELIIPCKPNRHIHIAPWSIDFLKESFLKNPQPQNKKFFICRQSSFGRCVENESELWKFLSKKGYEKCYLEDLSVYEQASLFNSAEEIVAVHGAALTNLVFCQPETKVIELFNPSYFLCLYWNICNILNLDYHYIIGKGDNLGKEKGKNQNIIINIEEFKNFYD